MTNPEISISVEHITKEFRLGNSPAYGRFSEVLQNILHAPFKKRHQGQILPQKFLALDDINFEVKQGDILGIIGRNGAGKSTLLKILSRITPPSSGRFGIRGRIGSLLEVGTGFHPELTGRENVFLNGTIIGMKKREITRHFDEIVAFAEVEKFIDTPVKHYSSGMYMRLAFSVAAHLDPEILIVDEVLAVGDTGFQKKCLEKMKVIGTSGKTILFVSHHLSVVRNLCKTALWLDRGKLIESGNAQDVVHSFMNSWDSELKASWKGSIFSYAKEVELLAVSIKNKGSSDNTKLIVEAELEISICYHAHMIGAYWPSFLVYNSDDQILFSGAPILGFDHEIDKVHQQEIPPGIYESTCSIPANILQAGRYSLTINFNDGNAKLLMNNKGLLTFDMEESGLRKRGHLITWYGIVRPPMQWTTRLINPADLSTPGTL